MSELEPGLRLQVALASVSQLLHTLPVLKDCRQLLHRVALLVEPQVAAKGAVLTGQAAEAFKAKLVPTDCGNASESSARRCFPTFHALPVPLLCAGMPKLS